MPDGELGRLTDRDLLVIIYERTSVIQARLDDQERRIRSLERWRWMLAGATALAGAAITWLASIVPWSFLGRNK